MTKEEIINIVINKIESSTLEELISKNVII